MRLDPAETLLAIIRATTPRAEDTAPFVQPSGPLWPPARAQSIGATSDSPYWGDGFHGSPSIWLLIGCCAVVEGCVSGVRPFSHDT